MRPGRTTGRRTDRRPVPRVTTGPPVPRQASTGRPAVRPSEARPEHQYRAVSGRAVPRRAVPGRASRNSVRQPQRFAHARRPPSSRHPPRVPTRPRPARPRRRRPRPSATRRSGSPSPALTPSGTSEQSPLTTRRLLSPRRVPCGGPGPKPPRGLGPSHPWWVPARGGCRPVPGAAQRRKSTAVVFAPLITTATVSSGPGEYRPDSSAASAAQPPGSATRRSRSQSRSWARR